MVSKYCTGYINEFHNNYKHKCKYINFKQDALVNLIKLREDLLVFLVFFF